MDGSAAMDELDQNGVLKFTVDGDTEVSLTKDDLLIDVAQKGGFVTEEDISFRPCVRKPASRLWTISRFT